LMGTRFNTGKKIHNEIWWGGQGERLGDEAWILGTGDAGHGATAWKWQRKEGRG